MNSPQVDQEKVKGLRNKPGKDVIFNLFARELNCLLLFRFRVLQVSHFTRKCGHLQTVSVVPRHPTEKNST